MTEAEAVAIVHEALVGPDNLPLKLVRRQGFDEAQFQRVKSALASLVAAYQDRDSVPKALAYALVDVQATFQMGLAAYPTDVQQRIVDASEELVDLAYLLFRYPEA